MFDAPMDEDSLYASGNSWTSSSNTSFGSGSYSYGHSTTGQSNGMASQDGSGAPFAGWVAQGFSNPIAYRGALYEGEQQHEYYQRQAQLTYRDKLAFLRRSEYQINTVRRDAVDASREASDARNIAEIKKDRYREATDSGISMMLANGANAGVDLSWGSALDIMGKVVDDRALDFTLMQWENDNEVYKREKMAANISDKATIMLDEQRSESDSFDYQATMFRRAGADARRAARFKSYQAALNI